MKFSLALLLVSVSLLVSCNSDDSPAPGSDENPTLFIAGSAHAPTTGLWGATYWDGDQKVRLSDSNTESQITDVFIDGSDVYAVGLIRDASRNLHAVLWINGDLIPLTDQSTPSYAADVTVVNGQWYVSGWEIPQNGIEIAKYWKQAGEVVVGDGVHRSKVFGISVVNDEVTLVGALLNENDAATAVQWRNGTRSLLSKGTTSVATPQKIVRVGNDEYIYGWGFSNTSAKEVSIVWKNGVIQELVVPENLRGVSPTGMSIDKGNVYICGFGQSDNTTFHSVYYKNGELFELEFSSGSRVVPSGIMVINDQTFMIGTDSDGPPIVWHNGERQTPPTTEKSSFQVIKVR